MSKYERFIIYPLLLIALVYGFIGSPIIQASQKKFDFSLPTEVFDRIEAKEIVITNSDGVEVVVIGSTYDEGGLVETYSPEGVIGAEMITITGGGGISTYNKDGVRVTDMASTIGDQGGNGVVRIYNKNGRRIVFIERTTEGHGGLWVYDRYGEYPAFYGHER